MASRRVRAWARLETHGQGCGNEMLPIRGSDMGLPEGDPMKPDPIATLYGAQTPELMALQMLNPSHPDLEVVSTNSGPLSPGVPDSLFTTKPESLEIAAVLFILDPLEASATCFLEKGLASSMSTSSVSAGIKDNIFLKRYESI